MQEHASWNSIDDDFGIFASKQKDLWGWNQLDLAHLWTFYLDEQIEKQTQGNCQNAIHWRVETKYFGSGKKNLLVQILSQSRSLLI